MPHKLLKNKMFEVMEVLKREEIETKYYATVSHSSKTSTNVFSTTSETLTLGLIFSSSIVYIVTKNGDVFTEIFENLATWDYNISKSSHFIHFPSNNSLPIKICEKKSMRFRALFEGNDDADKKFVEFLEQARGVNNI